MSDIVIRVENLGKKYTIGHQQEERYTSLRDVIANNVKSWSRKLLPTAYKKEKTPDFEDFWALKDVSFEIKQGDRVGIIGRNGAGKSTLLKILSRITEPTTGKVKIKGRVASLLEVGTGFHPELTGRENIFLNGAILGMSKEEIKRKFDEIVAFAEIEKFLDTPVKRYSSGMYVRLAFAVAAHLEPEILIVDEVLAVGDTQFQKKCLGKMEDVGKEGRTVIFVSHQMSAIEQLCTHGLLLKKGSVVDYSANIYKITNEYLYKLGDESRTSEWINQTGKEFYNPWFTPLRFMLSTENGEKQNIQVRNDQEVWIQIEGIIETVDLALTLGYMIYDSYNRVLYWSYQTDTGEEKWPKLKEGYIVLRSKFPKRFLNEGTYRIELIGSLHIRKDIFISDSYTPTISITIEGGLSDSPYWLEKRKCLLAPVIEWEALC
jgi:lipopolysaccharide transport system ATP-binding protein